jgi:hypothetical protein
MAWPEDQNNPERNQYKKTSGNGVWMVFLILFLLVGGMLVYYQFYQGNGQWRFTLMHKANDTTFLSKLKSGLPAPKKTGDSINVVSKDTISGKDSMQHIKTAVQPPENVANEKTRKLKPVDVDDEPVTGTVYEVQIGTIENYDLKKYKAIFNNLHEEKEGKLTKLTLGRFEMLSQANAFKKDMIKLGLKDAWVVKKVNGVRTEK